MNEAFLFSATVFPPENVFEIRSVHRGICLLFMRSPFLSWSVVLVPAAAFDVVPSRRLMAQVTLIHLRVGLLGDTL